MHAHTYCFSCVAFLDLCLCFFLSLIPPTFHWFCYQLRALNARYLPRKVEVHGYIDELLFFPCLLVGYEWDVWSTSLKTTTLCSFKRQYSGHEFEQSPADGKGRRSLVGYGSWGCKKVGHDWAYTHTGTALRTLWILVMIMFCVSHVKISKHFIKNLSALTGWKRRAGWPWT